MRSLFRTGAFAVLLAFAAGQNVPAQPSGTATSIDSASLRIAARTIFEEALIPTKPTTHAEDRALADAIRLYQTGDAEDFKAFEDFQADYPRSGWLVAILTNLGLCYYHDGYFSSAISSWQQAWDLGKNVTEPQAKALVDRALGELIRMHARLGHAERLTELFAEMDGRSVTGPATEALAGAKQGLWEMQHEPGSAYLCGPMALKDLLLAQNVDYARVKFIDDYRSGPHGVTLAQVSKIADQARLSHRLVFRTPGQPIPVPSVVHWKVGHFAAVIARTGDQYQIRDPTFAAEDLWISRAAIDSQASGYFMVTSGRGDAAWRPVSLKEASSVSGMGYTTSNDPLATTPQDFTCLSCILAALVKDASDGIQNWVSNAHPSNGPPLAQYDFTEMVVSLKLTDTPVGYTPPIGPDAHVTITYNQREANQPATFNYFNISPKWTLNWLTYISDNPAANKVGTSVGRYVAGGGGVNYSGYNAKTGAFTPETKDASVLVLVSTNPIVYNRQLPDGSVEVYSQSNGATSNTRKVFLSQLIDPAGNAVKLTYDDQMRLTSLTDSTGRITTFSYGLTAQPLLVTAITDPFNRSAYLAYDTSSRLIQITDVLGLVSQFSYDSSSLVNILTTPYGKTQFSYGNNGNQRYLQATDPMGNTERVEFLQSAKGIAASVAAKSVPAGMKNLANEYLQYRDTYYWDKHAYAVAAGNYTMARNTHWNHMPPSTNVTASSVESIKQPLQNRIWFTYPGQSFGYWEGTLDKPNGMGQVLDDSSTQLTKFTYNGFGHVTDAIDAVGRETQLTYDTNQIDVLQVSQRTSASAFSTIATFTYNTQHLPLTYTDAAGQVTHYAYNAAGQLTSVTDLLGHVTSYSFDSLGNLLSVTNANSQTAESFTYDQFDRVATATDSEGYTLKYSYDAADRLTQETFPDGTTRVNTWVNLDLVSVKDRQQNVTQYTYDAVRNLVGITDPNQFQTKLGYWENGALKTLTDPKGNVTTWNIDLQSRVTSKQYADNSQVDYAYEATTSRLHSTTDALDQIKQYSYAQDDQLAGIQYLNAQNATPNVSFAYDPYFRRISSMVDGTGTTQYSYQPVGSIGALRLAQETGPFPNATIAYQYDPAGRFVQRKVDTSTETFTYDALNRQISHNSPLGSFTYGYLGQTGQVTNRLLSGSTVGTIWTYDTNTNDRRLKAITNNGPARSYLYNTTPENLITQITESPGPGNPFSSQIWNYGYDYDYRLLTGASSSGTNYGFQYDAAGNITSDQGPGGTLTTNINNLNQIVNFGDNTFKYDANGNLLSDGTRTYRWDAENRLIEASDPGNRYQSTQFAYDGLGRRVTIASMDTKRVPLPSIPAHPDATVNLLPSAQTEYLWCGEDLCQARDGNNAVIHRYFSEGELIPSSNTSMYYAQDQLGSVRDVLSGPSASRLSSTDYGPYGNVAKTNGSVSTDFGFAGLFNEKNTGLYLANQRAYDSATGSWLSRDALNEPSGATPYGYVNADPIDQIDHEGLFGQTVVAGGVPWATRAFCLENPEICAGLIYGGIVGEACVLLYRRYLGPPTGPQNPEEDCDEEWRYARAFCAKELAKPNPNRGLTGGYTDVESCARGHVSERCGGNPYIRAK